MNLKLIATKTGLFLKKHAPEIMLVVGDIAVGFGVYHACKATRKLDETLAIAESRKEELEGIKEELTEQEYKREATKVWFQNAGDLVKLYTPAGLLLIGGLASLNGSAIVLKKRNVALTAAYAVLKESFDTYRSRVRLAGDEGMKIDGEYVHGAATEDNVERKKRCDDHLPVTYTLLYDASTAKNFSHSDGVNLTILKAKQRYLSQKLRCSESGVLTLNDICKELDLYIDSYQDGDSWGVVYNPAVNGDQINLGFEDDFMFTHGYENSVWLKVPVVWVKEKLPTLEQANDAGIADCYDTEEATK